MFSYSIDEWTKSQELKSIQDQILNGQVPDGCKNCINSEKINGHSTRLGALKDYGTTIYQCTDIDYLDYRSSNICNFKCRSCEPFFSNGIANEIKKHTELKKFYQVQISNNSDLPESKTAQITDANSEWVKEHLADIKKIMFTGGEPTKIPEVRELLDHIIKSGNLDIHVLITSNASFTDDYWFEITKMMPNIHWTLSLDAVGAAAEVIRAGTDWATVSRNIEKMFDISPSVNIGSVISNLNVMQLKPLFRFINDLARKYSHRPNGKTQFIQICQYPRFMAPFVLPPDLSRQAKEYLDSIDHSGLQKSQSDCVYKLKEIFDNIKEPTRSRWKWSQEYNNLLDKIRGQSHEWLFQPMH